MHGNTDVHHDDHFCLTCTGNRKIENGYYHDNSWVITANWTSKHKPSQQQQQNVLRECKMKVVSVQNMKTWGNRSIPPLIRNLDNRWPWVVSFTHPLLWPGGNSRRSPINRRLGRPQYQFWHLWKGNDLLTTPTIEPRTPRLRIPLTGRYTNRIISVCSITSQPVSPPPGPSLSSTLNVLSTKNAALLIFESRCCYTNLNSFLGVSTNTVLLLFAFSIRPNPLPA